jgi:SMC interacting uncharacterized protein involved in chromosome segregation
MANPNQDARNGKGRYIRIPETARRDAQAADLRAKGWTYQKIADELGYADKRTAYDAVERALKDVVREPGTAVLHFELERLDQQLVRLNEMEAAARKVLDDQPLQAIDRLVKIEDVRNRNAERRANLTGLNAAIKVDATVHEVTQQDLELQEMVREAEAAVAADRAKREAVGEG